MATIEGSLGGVTGVKITYNPVEDLQKEDSMSVSAQITIRKVENGWVVNEPTDCHGRVCAKEWIYTDKKSAINKAKKMIGEHFEARFTEK